MTRDPPTKLAKCASKVSAQTRKVDVSSGIAQFKTERLNIIPDVALQYQRRYENGSKLT